jgi:hypothetical protein
VWCGPMIMGGLPSYLRQTRHDHEKALRGEVR